MLKQNASKSVLVMTLGAVFVTVFSQVAHGEVLDSKSQTPAQKQSQTAPAQEQEIELKPLRSLRLVLPSEIVAKTAFPSTTKPGAPKGYDAEDAKRALSERAKQLMAEQSGVEPWNPETASVSRCDRFVEMKTEGVPRRSPEFLAAYADCNELIVDLLREDYLRTGACDSDLTRMVRSQLLVSKSGDAQLLLNVRDSEAARIAVTCLGESK